MKHKLKVLKLKEVWNSTAYFLEYTTYNVVTYKYVTNGK